jgi:hypothetical protein
MVRIVIILISYFSPSHFHPPFREQAVTNLTVEVEKRGSGSGQDLILTEKGMGDGNWKRNKKSESETIYFPSLLFPLISPH